MVSKTNMLEPEHTASVKQNGCSTCGFQLNDGYYMSAGLSFRVNRPRPRECLGEKLHIGFSVLWCLIDSIFTDTLRWATSSIKAWTLSRLVSPDAVAPACFSEVLGFPSKHRHITSKPWVTWGDWTHKVLQLQNWNGKTVQQYVSMCCRETQIYWKYSSF